ncbi:MAG: T9SS type A sorting domain-containing protein [Bacteroidetes bacterium]|nr:T9SS type A sorting domain-containing protein [Bacteroidota bacterium]
MKKFYSLLLFILPTFLAAQNSFEEGFESSAYEEIWAVHQTADGNYVCAGSSRGTGAFAFLIKTDPLGDTLWSRSYVNGSNTICNDMRITSDHGFILTGTTSNTTIDPILIKTDSIGNVEWARTFVTSTLEYCNAVCEVQDGYIITGDRIDQSASTEDIFLIKVDLLGNLVWQRELDHPTGARATGIVSTLTNGCVVTGNIVLPSFGYAQLLLTCIDSSGLPLWSKGIHAFSYVYGYSICKTQNNGYAACGDIQDSFGLSQTYITSVDSSGNIIWSKILKTNAGCDGDAISETSDHGLIITGASGSPAGNLFAENDDITKLDSSGNVQWFKEYGGDGNSTDWGNAIEQTADGGFLNGGYSGMGMSGAGYFIKTDALGNIPCNGYPGTYVFANENVTQTSFNIPFQNLNSAVQNANVLAFDFTCPIIDPCTLGIDVTQNSQNSPLVFPNPSSGKFTFQNLSPGNKIEIYDLTGRIILQKTIRSANETFDLSENESGIYFYHIINGQQTISQGKLILSH